MAYNLPLITSVLVLFAIFLLNKWRHLKVNKTKYLGSILVSVGKLRKECAKKEKYLACLIRFCEAKLLTNNLSCYVDKKIKLFCGGAINSCPGY